MSKLLEVLGKGLEVNAGDFIALELKRDGKESALNQIVDQLINNQVVEAETNLGFYLHENPSSVNGRLAAAAVLIINHDVKNAANELNSVLGREPNNTVALYSLGYCCELLGDEAQAIQHYQQSFKSNSKLPMERLAAIHLKNDRVDEVIKQYVQIVDLYPEDFDSNLLLGYLKLANHNVKEAVDILGSAILKHPDNLTTKIECVDCLVEQGRFEDALDQINCLLEYDTDNAFLIFKRGDIFRYMDQFTEAREQYERAIQIIPNFLEANIKLAVDYGRTGEHELVGKHLLKAVEINDQIVDAYIGYATAKRFIGDFEGYVNNLSLASAINPNSLTCFYGAVLAQYNQFFDSGLSDTEILRTEIEAFEKQVEDHPANPISRYYLGNLLLTAGSIKEAVDHLSTVLQTYQTHFRARYKMCLALFELDKKRDALFELTNYVMPSLNDIRSHYNIALRYASGRVAQERVNYPESASDYGVSLAVQNLGLTGRNLVAWSQLLAINKALLRE